MAIDQSLCRYLCNRSAMRRSLFFAVVAMVTANGGAALHQLREMETAHGRPHRSPKSVGECGGVYTDTYGQFQSPNYPMLYPNDALCTYRISLPPGKSIWLQFVLLELEQSLECDADYIRIYKGANDIGEPIHTLCGFNNSLPAIKVNSSELYIVFKSDSVGNARGFKVEYFTFWLKEWEIKKTKSYEMCKDSVAMAIGGIVLSHGDYPGNGYANQTVCKLLISPSGKYDGVKIEFFDVHLKVFSDMTCRNEGERIVVYKTFHREHLQICRNDWQKLSVLVPGNTDFPVLLTFQTGQHHLGPYRGFKAIYTQYYADNKYLRKGMGCKSGDFHCSASRICIPDALVCDGYNHCGDFQDERDCGKEFSPPRPEEVCNPDEYYCGDYARYRSACIFRQNAVCDGWRDCPNGADERDCLYPPNKVSGDTIVGIIIGILISGFVVAMIAMYIYRKIDKRRDRKKRMKKEEEKKEPEPTAV